MLQTIFILLGLLGILMLFWGTKTLINITRRKTVLTSPLVPDHLTFEIEKPGIYSFCFLGGWKVSKAINFKINVYTPKNDRIPIKMNSMPYKSIHKSNRLLQYASFNADQLGTYSIELTGIENIVIKSSLHPFLNLLQSKKSLNRISFLIQESISIWKYSLATICLVLGIQLSIWGAIIGINPTIFG